MQANVLVRCASWPGPPPNPPCGCWKDIIVWIAFDCSLGLIFTPRIDSAPETLCYRRNVTKFQQNHNHQLKKSSIDGTPLEHQTAIRV
jgi:hypothetical protein